jgi:DNA-binding LacI/PurR family transcriptional regulator
MALADGFIYACDLEDCFRLDILAAHNLPIVIIDGHPRASAAHVGIDNSEGARLAAKHLIDLGHRRLAIITLRIAPNSHEGLITTTREASTRYVTTGQRLDGYRAAIKAAGLDPGQIEMYECGSSSQESGYRAALALVDRAPADRPTGLLVMSDELALGALRMALDHGIAVPGDLSIVGFDDAPGAVVARPALTTIRQPHFEKGVTAVQLLLDQSLSTTSLVLPIELVVRSSTGPAPL